MKKKLNTKTVTGEKIDLDIQFEIPTNKGDLISKGTENKIEKITLNVRDNKGKPVNLNITNPEILNNANKVAMHINNRLRELGIEVEDDIDFRQEIRNVVAGNLIGRNRDSEEGRKPPEAENLPVLVSKEVYKFDKKIYPKWTKVKELPGYFSGAIRAFGRKVFKALSPDTKLEDFLVISTVGGLNTNAELDAVARFLKNKGHKNEHLTGIINDMLPEYSVKVAVFNYGDYVWLVVQDFAGKYIYAAPSTGNKIEFSGRKEDIKKIEDSRNYQLLKKLFEEENWKPLNDISGISKEIYRINPNIKINWYKVEDFFAFKNPNVKEAASELMSLFVPGSDFEDYYFVTTLVNMYSEQEINFLIKYLSKRGKISTDVSNQYRHRNYVFDVVKYYYNNCIFLIVKDFMGIYVYLTEASNETGKIDNDYTTYNPGGRMIN